MKLVSWNVNGIRACMNKGFKDAFDTLDADIFCVQEIKMKPGQMDLSFDGYEVFMNSAVKAGYSGTATWTKHKPLSVHYGIDLEHHDQEGRVITLEFENFYLVNCYTPNAQRQLARLDYRMQWEDDFRAFLLQLNAQKPVILCGDLNVAHNEIDLKNPSQNHKNAGFSDEERAQMTQLLSVGFVDSFRYFYPDLTDQYTWWSYITKARERNAGWRIDYFIVSEKLKDKMLDAHIHPDIMGSDHCPVSLDINL